MSFEALSQKLSKTQRFYTDSTHFFRFKNTANNDSLKFALIVIPFLEPSKTFSLKVKIRSNDTSQLNLNASVGNPLLDSIVRNKLGLRSICEPFEDECRNAILDYGLSALNTALSLAPTLPTKIASCGLSMRDYACQIADMAKGEPQSVSSAIDFGFTLAALTECITSGLSSVANATKVGLANKSVNAAAKALSGEIGSPTLEDILWDLLGFLNGAEKLREKCKTPKEPKKAKSNPPSRNSRDPNLKVGLKGRNLLNAIDGSDLMPFTIYFENADSATAPASEVTVLDQLDTTVFDISTLQFTGFGFGDSSYTLPPQSKTFVREVDFRPRKNMRLRVTGDLDANGKLMWYLGSFDPKTNDVTQNIDDGFLPPNVRKPEGEGYVSYTIRPKANLPHLTSLKNKADIIFDYNAAIVTPVWTNTVDRLAPISRVNSIRRVQGDTVFVLKWSGTDAHAGVMDYNIYVSEDGATYQIYYRSIESDSALFVGKIGKSYSFYSVARDYVGNIESKTPTAEVSTGRVATNEIDEIGNWLGQNIPNPFAGSTIIPFYLTETKQIVKLEIISITGSIMKTLNQSNLVKGEHRLNVDLSNLPTGVYFYRLYCDGKYLIKKLVIINMYCPEIS